LLTMAVAEVDPDVAGQRMKMLETQKKRLKQELAEAVCHVANGWATGR